MSPVQRALSPWRSEPAASSPLDAACPPQVDYLIVGAGFAGATCARALADAGLRCLVIDQRPYVGGNAHDRFDAHGVRVHSHGPHIFHTNAEKVFEWLSRFTAWRPYEHRVLAEVDGQQLPMPINRTTINRLYGLDLDEAGVAAFLEARREPRSTLATSEDVVLNSVGRELCDKFFSGYTRKQWGRELNALSAGVAARIPTRCDDDDRYFTDRFQAMPLDGYTALFERMLAHPLVNVLTDTAYASVEHRVARRGTVYTGPIDAFFGHCFGHLPYRSLRFEHAHIAGLGQYQRVGTVNYPNEHAFTRVTEFRHLTGQPHSGTSIVREYPCAEGDPYYPIPSDGSQAMYQRYAALAATTPRVHFVGRLAQYRYYNMDQAVAAALSLASRLVGSSARTTAQTAHPPR
jgi:UDP-galactopyranose mutase